MSNTSLPRRSVRINPALVTMYASPESLLRTSNLLSFKTVGAAPDREIEKATRRIDKQGLTTMLHRISSEIDFYEKIVEAGAAARSEDQTDADDDETDKDHG